jgi:DNA transformation protein and related proteins
MGMSREQVESLEELFSVLPGCRVKRMFGGAGIFREGLMIAVSLDEGRLAFKADPVNEPDYRDEGLTEWTYPHKSGKQMSMGYWHIPERLLDEPDEFREWARKAFEAAVRADLKKPPKQRKRVAL